MVSLSDSYLTHSPLSPYKIKAPDRRGDQSDHIQPSSEQRRRLLRLRKGNISYDLLSSDSEPEPQQIKPSLVRSSEF